MEVDPALRVAEAPRGPGPAQEGPPAGDDEVLRIRRTEQQHWLRRRDLERQLHDGAALRISAISLRLALVRRGRVADDEEFQSSVDALQDELHEVLQELRDIARRLYPPLLDQAGLGPALEEAGARLGRTVRVVSPEDRFGPAAEGAAYFTLLEALTTEPGRTPDARPVDVAVRRDGDVLELLVAGLDPCHAASVHDGVRHLGGTAGTHGSDEITVRIPCE
jgi:signal transduction histidine kinase